MQRELIQLTRERNAADPIRYLETRTSDIPDHHFTIDAAQLPAMFADILEYPDERWHERIDLLAAALSKKTSPANDLAEFRSKVDLMELIELQELYTQSFDLNPNCAMEIGYHIFGEDYKRGLFLANLRETQDRFQLGQEQQLPDYLPVLLRTLTHFENDEIRGSLVADCMIPGLRKILSALKAENPYAHLLNAVLTSLKYGIDEPNGRNTSIG